MYDKGFKEIWGDIDSRSRVMDQINNVEKFCNCTQLCKPHESNKMMWHIHENIDDEDEISSLEDLKVELHKILEDPEFI